MPAGLIRHAAFSSAPKQLFASCWNSRVIPYPRVTPFNAPPRYSSIADAMLGRAANKYEQEPPAQKPPLSKKLFSSSSPAPNGNIEEQFGKARKSSQSIGAFTGYTNTTAPLHPKSANIRQSVNQRASSVASTVPSTSRLSVFSREDSFQPPTNTPSTPIDLTQEDSSGSKQSIQSNHPAVHFDENDFDDDDDLDLDMEFEIPTALTMPAPPKPQRTAAQPPYSLPPAQRQRHQTQNPSSSAMTWSSSPPSHRVTPPRAKRLLEESTAQESIQSSINKDPNSRSSKRRTLPWLQTQAEKDDLATKREEETESATLSSPPLRICAHCKKAGHASSQCPKSGKWDYTPKEKNTPWNITGSAIREEKKKFKDKQKAFKTLDKSQAAAIDRRRKSNATVAGPIVLSEEQERVKKLVISEAKSVFFTGSAGTGKSVLMRAIIADLRKKYMKEPDRVAVTASTGLAACNIGGVTLHSFGGIGLGKEDVPALVKKIRRNPKAKNRWIRTKILIIDEISMVDGDLFDKLEGIARAMRNNGRPFGGIQLVITGDFFQLPPVPEYDNKARGIKFAFDAGTWPTAIHHTIGLTEVFRQKDPVFANMLNEMRLGKISDETVQAFKSLNRAPTFEDSIAGTELFPTRNEVDNANAFRMRDLIGTSYRFDASDTGTVTDENFRDKLLANMMAPKSLELKKGAQVMLIKNLDEVCVNGSLGKVIAFMNENTFDTYIERGEDAIAPGSFDENAGVQSDASCVSAGYSNKQEGRPNTGRIYPVVEFILADGTVRRMLMMPEEWKIELPSGEIQAQRQQLPLILAWALSIHKAQGQTLERVKIDLKKIFEKGQAYVALSRATSQEGLQVLNFDKSKVMAHPRVAQFYNSLYSVNKALRHPTVAKVEPKKEKSYTEQFAKTQKQKVLHDFTEEEEAELAMYG
ncbi:ATP-dependent DNA helicase [Lachnellula subtilissima]|uniref:ATP-dependent DNA helicase PIF1 n=1 Tax=Lachnellula subtilissima TaxID=602034 RepID=A0A8H8RJD5_9HELO|nr:ATP-dependent DNA helicase [Lachnellula subtilissima]